MLEKDFLMSFLPRLLAEYAQAQGNQGVEEIEGCFPLKTRLAQQHRMLVMGYEYR
ncbi:hypothetical protein [Pseudomonas cannabina]|uniref:hypothetical protein n=1 Tax=Pseudomonas cannabina TaxID=86840 RepID=UPI0012E1FEF6|nr:hypothetical protein [Pseudomonas cannabina]